MSIYLNFLLAISSIMVCALGVFFLFGMDALPDEKALKKEHEDRLRRMGR